MLTSRRRLFQYLTLAPLLAGALISPAAALGPINIKIILEGTANEADSDAIADYETSDSSHLRFTPSSLPSAEDQAAAEHIVETVRDAIAPYADISMAAADGYFPFPPEPGDSRIVQYVNLERSWKENWEFDPRAPGSLLYEQQPDGSLRLTGALFTAPEDATTTELNQRVPLAIARWHQHINICLPDPVWDVEQWRLEYSGQPRFGPESIISTRAACEAVGGDFWPTIFGWMVRVHVFADDPSDVWKQMH